MAAVSRALFNDATIVTVGWISPYAALVSAILTTRQYRKENTIAGLTAIVSYVMIFYHSVRGSQLVEMRYFNIGWFVIGVLIGYLVGRIFVKWGKPLEMPNHRINYIHLRDNVMSNMKLVTFVLIGAFLIHLLYAICRVFGLDSSANQAITSMIGGNSNYFLNISISLINTLFVWLGFG